MANVLERIRKIRELDERRARLKLLDSQRQFDDMNRDLTSIGQRVEASHSRTQHQDAAEVARHHAFALQMEMQRRQQQAQCVKHLELVDQDRRSVLEASRETKVAELVVERAAEVLRRLAAAKENRSLDEMGTQGWFRGQRKAG